ncbi:MAG: MFS transporter [Actinomycetota bacterium]|nr:MFS transporter [Actinomycetota bacterium]
MRDTKNQGEQECKPGSTEADRASKAFQRTEEDVQIKPAAYRDLLRNRDFLHLWAGQMVSAIGDWVIVAVLFTFVDELSGGKSYAISLMMVAKFLPAVLLGFLAGIIIDRLDRKRTLIACDLCRAMLVILFAFSNTLLMIMVLVFIIETFTIIYGPAKDASIPDLVSPEQLTNANSLNQLTLYASMAFGTAIAGTVIGIIAWLGRINGFIGENVDPNRAAFFVDSLTFIASAFLIYRIKGFKRRSEEEKVKMSSSQVKEDLKQGMQYLWNHRLTRIVLILTLACFLGGGTIYVLTVGFVKYVLGGGDSTFMYILTVLLFGMMAGSVLAGVLRTRVKKERIMGLSIAGFGTGVVVFSLVSVLWLSFVVAFIGGAFMGYAIVGMITLLHETLEEEYRGRAFAAIQVIMRASIFLSIIVAGPLADLITALGRKIGFDPFSFFIFRLGGSYVGEIDGSMADFRYLFNGPQIILLIGGIVVFLAGIYGQRAFHNYFECEGWDVAYSKEIVEEPGVEAGKAAPAGVMATTIEGGVADTVMEEIGEKMEEIGEVRHALEVEETRLAEAGDRPPVESEDAEAAGEGGETAGDGGEGGLKGLLHWRKRKKGSPEGGRGGKRGPE